MLSCEEESRNKVPALKVKLPMEETIPLKLSSKLMLQKNPLLPSLEKNLWSELLKAEQKLLAGDDSARIKFIDLAQRITRLHPFQEDKSTATLGGISWLKKENIIELDAQVTSPANDDYIELILCNKNGRSHESLLISECRPLHLEILLHFAGFNKEVPTSFKLYIALPGKEIPVEDFLNFGKETFPKGIYWDFIGSPYVPGNYKPDLNGDHILLWNRHDAILQCSNKEIHSGTAKVLLLRDKALPDGTLVKLRMKPVE